MTMTPTEQNSLNQALQTAKTGTAVTTVQTQDGINQYVICKLVPVQTMTPAQFTAFAAVYSVTIAAA